MAQVMSYGISKSRLEDMINQLQFMTPLADSDIPSIVSLQIASSTGTLPDNGVFDEQVWTRQDVQFAAKRLLFGTEELQIIGMQEMQWSCVCRSGCSAMDVGIKQCEQLTTWIRGLGDFVL